MSARDGWIVDWKEQFDRLEPYLTARGGVVHAMGSEAAGRSAFSKALRQRMREDWPRPFTSVQVDSWNPQTHYVEDILEQIERSLGITGGGAVSAGVVRVGTENQAPTLISNVTIEDEDERSRQARAADRARRIGEEMRERSGEERLAVLFLRGHRSEEPALLSRFTRHVWDPVLEKLLDAGLLVIDISDGRASGAWPPEADLVLDLPERYSGDEEREAEKNLIQIALRAEVASSLDEAVIFARTLLASSDNVRDLHARLGRTLARLASRIGGVR